MATSKKALFGTFAVKAWDVAGEKSLNAALAISTKKFSKNMQENYDVKSEQIIGLTEWVSGFSAYIITQAIHKQKIDDRKISDMIYSNLVPMVFSIASNNPKGEEIIIKISEYIGMLTQNNAFESIISQFAGNQVAEQLRLATNAIAALNNPPTEEQMLPKIDEAKILGAIDSEEKVTTQPEVIMDIPAAKEEMTDEEDEQFVSDVFGAIVMDFSSPEAAKASFDKFVTVAGEVAKFSELQETKRAQINADAEIAIKKVEAMRDVLKQYLEKSFDERSAIFMKQFEVVNQALAKGDNTMLSAGLTAINELAASSPFKALADINSVQQMLTNDSEFDL